MRHLFFLAALLLPAVGLAGNNRILDVTAGNRLLSDLEKGLVLALPLTDQTEGNDRSAYEDSINAVVGTPVYTASEGVTLDGAGILKHFEANWRGSDSAGSIICRAKITDVSLATSTIFSSADTATDIDFMRLFVDPSGVFKFQHRETALGSNIVSGGFSAVQDATWYSFGVSASGSAWKLYLDGVEGVTNVVSGSDTGVWFADIGDRDLYALGATSRTADSTILAGSMLDCQVWDRVLTAPEFLADYNRGPGGAPRVYVP